MIDFSKVQEIPGTYGGSELKKTIVYNDEIYMMKFPDPIRQRKIQLSYMNNQFSEHIGCQIFRSCGIDTQETILGIFNTNLGNKVVVACKDFTKNGSELLEFRTFVNAHIIDGYKRALSIESVYAVVENSDLIKNKKNIIEQFWDMFVIDALIGNTDRHFDNWGLIKKDGNLEFSPIYDCGSSLSALLSDEEKEANLADETRFKNQEYNVSSTYKMEKKRIFYHEIIKDAPIDLKLAIDRMVPRIHIEKIEEIVKNTEYISELNKEYLIKSINLRYKEILLPAWKNS